MAGRLFEAVDGISSGDDEPPVLELSLPPLPNRALALPPPPNQALAFTRSTAVDSEASPLSSHPDPSAQTAKAASDAKSWLKPKAHSQLDAFKSEAAARAKAIQSGKVGAVHPSASCGRGRGRGRGCSGRSTGSVASSSMPLPSLPTNDDGSEDTRPTRMTSQGALSGRQ